MSLKSNKADPAPVKLSYGLPLLQKQKKTMTIKNRYNKTAMRDRGTEEGLKRRAMMVIKKCWLRKLEFDNIKLLKGWNNT